MSVIARHERQKGPTCRDRSADAERRRRSRTLGSTLQRQDSVRRRPSASTELVHPAWGRALTVMFAGAASAPLVAASIGWPLEGPFGVPLAVLVVVLLAGLSVDALVCRLRRESLRDVLADCVGVALFAALTTLTIRRRANGFYTSAVLIEALTILLLAHLVGRSLRFVFLTGRWGTEERPTRWPAAVSLADALTRQSVWWMLAFWVLAWVPYREAAGVCLIIVGVLQVVVAVLRFPDALLATRAHVRGRRWPRAPFSSFVRSGSDCHPPTAFTIAQRRIPCPVTVRPDRELRRPGRTPRRGAFAHLAQPKLQPYRRSASSDATSATRSSPATLSAGWPTRSTTASTSSRCTTRATERGCSSGPPRARRWT